MKPNIIYLKDKIEVRIQVTPINSFEQAFYQYFVDIGKWIWRNKHLGKPFMINGGYYYFDNIKWDRIYNEEYAYNIDKDSSFVVTLTLLSEKGGI